MTFALFTCDQFYPRGGWRDYYASFETLHRAITVALEITRPGEERAGHGWHVIDLQALRLVAQG